MESLPLGAELFYANRRTDGGWTYTLLPLDAFLECANAPKNEVRGLEL